MPPTDKSSELKPLSSAIARIIDRIGGRYLLDDDPNSFAKDSVKFRCALVGGVIFSVGLLIALGSLLATEILPERYKFLPDLPRLMTIATMILFSINIFFAYMISYVRKAGRIRAYLLGLIIPLITIFVISQAVRFIVGIVG